MTTGSYERTYCLLLSVIFSNPHETHILISGLKKEKVTKKMKINREIFRLSMMIPIYGNKFKRLWIATHLFSSRGEGKTRKTGVFSISAGKQKRVGPFKKKGSTL